MSLLRDRFYAACDAMNSGDYEEAIAVFHAIIDEVPEYIDAYNQLGLALAWSGHEEEGQLILEKGVQTVLALFPRDFFEKHYLLEWGWLDNRPFLRCYANLGLCYLENERYDKAKTIFERILIMNPTDNQGVRDLLLNCYFGLGKLEAALELCNRYQEDLLVGISYGRALALYKLGNRAEAKKQFLAAMRFFPRVAKELIKLRHTKPKDYGVGPGVIIGSQEEAYDYWLSFGQYWKATTTVMPFIKNCIEEFKKIKIDLVNGKDDFHASATQYH
jgi:tetratricopeptide (TPR) repeat protein